MLSKRAALLEKILRGFGIKRILSRKRQNPDRKVRYELPPGSFSKKYVLHREKIAGMKCVTVRPEVGTHKYVLYFHGGAYTKQARRMHWTVVDRMIAATHCAVTFINYPLAPQSTCEKTVQAVLEAYQYLCKDDGREVILAGDSSGGGLALVLAQNIKLRGISPKPSKVILLSPWLDVSMNDDIPKETAGSDLILDNDALRLAGLGYAGNLSTKDPLCSPIYGEFSDIGQIALFTGTNDILNIQARALRDRIACNNGGFHYYEYEDMQHVWMVFPIPEAGDAMRKVCDFIQKDL